MSCDDVTVGVSLYPKQMLWQLFCIKRRSPPEFYIFGGRLSVFFDRRIIWAQYIAQILSKVCSRACQAQIKVET